MKPRFVVDLNVGRLAKWLRVMGYDALFVPRVEDDELIRIATHEKRVNLTRDALLMQRRAITLGHVRAFLITYHDVWAQINQVVEGLRLDSAQDFSRCVECNIPLERTSKESVEGNVPPYVFETQKEFMVGPRCTRVYWRGTHWHNMRRELARVRGEVLL